MRYEFKNLIAEEKQAVRQLFTELQGILAPKGVTLPSPEEFSGSFPQLPYLNRVDRKRAYELIKAIIPYSELHWQREHDHREYSKLQFRQRRAATQAHIRAVRSRPEFYAEMHPFRLTEQAVTDLENAEQAMALFYNGSCDDPIEYALSLSVYREDAYETGKSIDRGIALSVHYELVNGKRCDVSLSPVIPQRALVYTLRPAGWFSTAEMHRHVAVALKHGHADFVG